MNTPTYAEQFLRIGNWHVDRSHSLHRLRIGIHIALLLVIICEALHVLRPHLAVVMILALTVASIFLQYGIRTHHGAARLVRFRLLLCDSMPMTSTDYDADYFLATHAERLARLSHRPVAVKDYYSSAHPPGPTRLRENLAETLFFSGHGFRAAQRHLDAWLMLPTLAAFCFLLLAPFLDANSIMDLDRILILLIVLYNEVELVTQRFEYGHASTECLALLAHLRDLPPTDARLLFVTGMYASISAAAPPTHPGLYHAGRNFLNRLWAAERHHYQ